MKEFREVVWNERYEGPHGATLVREYETQTPHGNTAHGFWVLRDADGEFVDMDQYRNDVADRRGLELIDL